MSSAACVELCDHTSRQQVHKNRIGMQRNRASFIEICNATAQAQIKYMAMILRGVIRRIRKPYQKPGGTYSVNHMTTGPSLLVIAAAAVLWTELCVMLFRWARR